MVGGEQLPEHAAGDETLPPSFDREQAVTRGEVHGRQQAPLPLLERLVCLERGRGPPQMHLVRRRPARGVASRAKFV